MLSNRKKLKSRVAGKKDAPAQSISTIDIKMSDESHPIYTRAELKGMKENHDKEIHEQNVKQVVSMVSSYIIGSAKSTNDTSCVYDIGLLFNDGFRKSEVLTEAIQKLKEIFIDLSIEHCVKKDARSKYREGIYIDWS